MREIILLGLIIGIIFYELTEISPGGLVVPGMIAYYIFDPYRILMTVGISIISFFIVKLVNRYMILYGKRKYIMHIVIATILSTVISLISNKLNVSFLAIPVIGYIIPGIISNEMDKQGPIKTLIGLTIVTGIIGLLVLLVWN